MFKNIRIFFSHNLSDTCSSSYFVVVYERQNVILAFYCQVAKRKSIHFVSFI